MTHLCDLNASFVVWTPDGFRSLGQSAKGANGVWFTCPNPDHNHGVLLWFSNPLDCEPAPLFAIPHKRWHRMGECIANLTLAPSIVIEDDWHGFVIQGSAKLS